MGAENRWELMEKNLLELNEILTNATMVRIETTFAPALEKNMIRARDNKGNYKELYFSDLAVDMVKLKVYDHRTVTDMWASGYKTADYRSPNNIGVTIEDGILICGVEKKGKDLVISCDLPRR